MARTIQITYCKGEGQGSCKRCEDKGIWDRRWMCFLNEISINADGHEITLDGCYCSKCTKEIEEEFRKEGQP